MRQAPSAETQRIFAPAMMEGQVGIVTGGGSGIGLATAAELVRLGGRVVICGRTREKLDAATAELAALSSPSSVMAETCDIREPEQVDTLVARALERFGRIDLLVNNAGGQFPAAPGDISDNGWRAVVDLNLNGTWNMISRFAPAMIERGSGAIVNVVHVYSFERAGPFVHSGAARAGVVQLTYSLAQMAGRSNVRVNAIAPGTVDTLGMTTNEADVLQELQGLEDFLGDVIRCTPMQRLGEPDEVAGAVLFLCSPAGRWVNGVALRVDGGEYAANWVDLFPDRSF